MRRSFIYFVFASGSFFAINSLSFADKSDGSGPINSLSPELKQMIAKLTGPHQARLALVNSDFNAQVKQLNWKRWFDKIVSEIKLNKNYNTDSQFRIIRFLKGQNEIGKISFDERVPGTDFTFGRAFKRAQANLGTALIDAIRADSGHPANEERYKSLIQQGADPNWTIREDDQRTPLFYALQTGDPKAVELLLQAPGIDVNKTDDHGRCPLFAHAGHPPQARATQAFELLIQDPRTNVNATDSSGRTLLFYSHRPDLIQLLLNHPRFDRNIKAKEATVAGDTPLQHAAYDGHIDTIRILLDAGVDIHEASARGQTALTIAANSGQIESMKALLDRGSDINFVSGKTDSGSVGETALRSAISSYAYRGSKPEKIEDTVAAIQLILSRPDLDIGQAEKEFQRLYFERKHCSARAKKGLDAAYETMVSDSRFKALESKYIESGY